MTKELQLTYGNFKLRGLVQGLKRGYAYDDKPTKNGYPKHQLQFSVKTSEDNIVQVNVEGLGFDKVRITPKDRKDKSTEDIKRGEAIPEEWEVMMGVTTGLEQDEKDDNILKNFDNYDAAEYIFNNLQDGDFVFIGGRTEFRKFTNQKDEEIVINNLNVNRIYHSKGSLDQEDFEEMSSFNQFVILNDIDLDKKEKKAHVSAFIIVKDFGETKVVPYQFWVDGNKYNGLVNNLRKLPFGTQIKVEGKVHSRPIYQEVEEVEDGWGEHSTGFQPRQSISGVNKSYEITLADPSTIEEEKYTQEDLFPPVEENNSDDLNPFDNNNDDHSNDWGQSQNSDSSIEDDPFRDDSF